MPQVAFGEIRRIKQRARRRAGLPALGQIMRQRIAPRPRHLGFPVPVRPEKRVRPDILFLVCLDKPDQRMFGFLACLAERGPNPGRIEYRVGVAPLGAAPFHEMVIWRDTFGLHIVVEFTIPSGIKQRPRRQPGMATGFIKMAAQFELVTART